MHFSHNALTLDKTAEAIIMELGIKWHTSHSIPDSQTCKRIETHDLTRKCR